VNTPAITPVILCGGSGTRLWPLSRANYPKQFANLTGERSTFQETLQRVSDPNVFATPIIVTNAEFRFLVAEQMRVMGQGGSIVLEPQSMDSAAAIAAAAFYAQSVSGRDTLLVLAADHIIPDASAFTAACNDALAAAQSDHIVTFGIKPRAPVTSYGYIRPGKAVEGSAVLKVESFMEKPDSAKAEQYVANGYLWNSGNFLFRSEIMLAELATYEPRIHGAAHDAVVKGAADLEFFRLEGEAFQAADRKSFDYAVMEKTTRAAVLPVAYAWSDVGSWNALWDISEKNADGNVVEGPVELIGTSNSIVRSDEAVLTTVVGLKNVVVVATSDAVLVAAQGEAEQVKELVSRLKNKGRKEVAENRRVYRPWGYYQCSDLGPRFQVKRISVKPGAQLSLQKHVHRSEHWVVVSGTAEVTVDDQIHLVHENQSTYIPIGSVHRLRNPGRINLELIEVQVGSYLGEDDIIRLDDVYGRR
jgi:mannose-1-phosphate guanylyltransferase / mannose-6-phosphate isomerase